MSKLEELVNELEMLLCDPEGNVSLSKNDLENKRIKEILVKMLEE